MKIEEVLNKTVPELIDLALSNPKPHDFWFVCGAICAAIDFDDYGPQADAWRNFLWRSGYGKPVGDYEEAVRLLKHWQAKASVKEC